MMIYPSDDLDDVDEADLANDHLQRELEQRILDVQRAKPLPPSSECLNCGDPPIEGGRFCCRDCADEHEARERQLKRSGLA